MNLNLSPRGWLGNLVTASLAVLVVGIPLGAYAVNDCSSSSSFSGCKVYLETANATDVEEFTIDNFDADEEPDSDGDYYGLNNIAATPYKVYRWDRDWDDDESPYDGSWTEITLDANLAITFVPADEDEDIEAHWQVTGFDRLNDYEEAIEGFTPLEADDEDGVFPEEGDSIRREYCISEATPPKPAKFGKGGCKRSDGRDQFYVTWVPEDHDANFPKELRYSVHLEGLFSSSDREKYRETADGDAHFYWFQGSFYSIGAPEIIDDLVPDFEDIEADKMQRPLSISYEVDGLTDVPGVGHVVSSGKIQGTPTATATGEVIVIRANIVDSSNSPVDTTAYPEVMTNFMITAPSGNDDNRPMFVQVCTEVDDLDTPDEDETETGAEPCGTEDNDPDDGESAEDKEERLTEALVDELELVSYVVGEPLVPTDGTSDNGYEWFRLVTDDADPPESTRVPLEVEQLITRPEGDANEYVYLKFPEPGADDFNGDEPDLGVTLKVGFSTLKVDEGDGTVTKSGKDTGLDLMTRADDLGAREVPFYLQGASNQEMDLTVTVTAADSDSEVSSGDEHSVEYVLEFTNEEPDWGSITRIDVDHYENDFSVVGGMDGPLFDLLSGVTPYSTERVEGDYQKSCLLLENNTVELTDEDGDTEEVDSAALMVLGEMEMDPPTSASSEHVAAIPYTDLEDMDRAEPGVAGVSLTSDVANFEESETGMVSFEVRAKDVVNSALCGKLDDPDDDDDDAPPKELSISKSSKTLVVNVNLMDADEAPTVKDPREDEDDERTSVNYARDALHKTTTIYESGAFVSEEDDKALDPEIDETRGGFSETDVAVIVTADPEFLYVDEDTDSSRRNNALHLFVDEITTDEEGEEVETRLEQNSTGHYGLTNDDDEFERANFSVDVDDSSGEIEIRGYGEVEDDTKTYRFYVDYAYELVAESLNDDCTEEECYVSTESIEEPETGGDATLTVFELITLHYRTDNDAPAFNCEEWTAQAVTEYDTEWLEGTGETVAETEGDQNYVFIRLENGGIDADGPVSCKLEDEDGDPITLSATGTAEPVEEEPMEGDEEDEPADDEEEEEMNPHRYVFSKTGTTGRGTEEITFVIDEDDPVPHNLMLNTGLDFETHAEHVVTVTATDIFGESDSFVLTVAVLDSPEVPIENEESDASEANVGTFGLVAMYPDPEDIAPVPGEDNDDPGDPPEIADDDYDGVSSWSMDVSDLFIDQDADNGVELCLVMKEDVKTKPETKCLASEDIDMEEYVLPSCTMKDPYDGIYGSNNDEDENNDVWELPEGTQLQPTVTLEDGVLTVESSYGFGSSCTVSLKANEVPPEDGVEHGTEDDPWLSDSENFRFSIKRMNRKPTFGNLTEVRFDVPEDTMLDDTAQGELSMPATDPDGDALSYDVWIGSNPTVEIPKEEWITGSGGKILLKDELDREFDLNQQHGYLEADEEQYTHMVLRAIDKHGAFDTVVVYIDVIEKPESPKLAALTASADADPEDEDSVAVEGSMFSGGFCVVTTAPEGTDIHEADVTEDDEESDDEDYPVLEASCQIGIGQTITIANTDLYVDEDRLFAASEDVTLSVLDANEDLVDVTMSESGTSFTLGGVAIAESTSMRVLASDGSDGEVGARGQAVLNVTVVENVPPVIAVQPPLYIEVREGGTYDLDLDDYFDDMDEVDEELSYSFSIDENENEDGESVSAVSVEQEGSVLTVTGEFTGPGGVHAVATDTTGNDSPSASFLFDVLTPAISVIDDASFPDLPGEDGAAIYAGDQVSLPSGEGVFKFEDPAVMEYSAGPEDFAHEFVEVTGEGGETELVFVPGMKGVATVTVTGSNDDGGAGGENCITEDNDAGTIICTDNPSASASFDVTVSNSAPVIAAMDAIELVAGGVATLAPEITDADGDTVITTLSTESDHVTVDSEAMTVTAHSAGYATIRVHADDVDGAHADLDVSVHIGNTDPIVSAIATDLSLVIGQSNEMMVTASDADSYQMLAFHAVSSNADAATVVVCGDPGAPGDGDGGNGDGDGDNGDGDGDNGDGDGDNGDGDGDNGDGDGDNGDGDNGDGDGDNGGDGDGDNGDGDGGNGDGDGGNGDGDGDNGDGDGDNGDDDAARGTGPDTPPVDATGEVCFAVTGMGVGSATVTFTVSDDHDPVGEASAALAVEVTNTPPTVTLGATELTIAGVGSTDESITVTADDADGHEFTLSVASEDSEIATASLMEMDVADPSDETGGTTVTATVVSINSVKVGSTTVTVTAEDEYGGTSSASVALTVTNTQPELSLAMSELTVVGVGVASVVGVQMSDKDGDTLTVTVESSDETVATASASMEDEEMHVTSTGVGEATITVTVDDGGDIDNTASAALAVTVTNRAPEIMLSASELTISGVEYTDDSIVVTTSDPDGHDVTMSVVSADPEIATSSLVEMVAQDPPVEETEGTTVISVNSVKVGSTTITVTAEDEYGGVSSASVALTVTNTRPEIVVAMEAITVEGVGVMVAVGYEASDKDGDTLTVTAESDDESVATASVSMEDSQVHVSSTSVGEATITVTVDDGKDIDNTVSVALAVTVMNRVPEIMLSASELTISGVESTNDSIVVTTSDADGHDVTMSVVSADPEIATASLVEMGAEDSEGEAEGTTVLSIASVKVGSTTVTVTAEDEEGGSVSASVEVTVTNTRPELAVAMEEITIEGVGVTVTVGYEASDKDGDNLTVTAASGDEAVATANVSMDDSLVHVSSMSVGETTITVTVDDGGDIDNTASAEFTVTVLNRDPEVTLSETAITITGVGVNVSVDGTATDPDGHTITLSTTSTAPDVAIASIAGSESGGPISVSVTSNSVGTAEITVMAVDPYAGSGSATLAVTVENRPPTISVAPESITIDGVGETGSATVIAGDPDGHEVTVSVASADEGVATASLSGTALTVTSISVGSTTITLTASDGQASNDSASSELAVEVLNRDPVVTLSESELTIAGVENTNESVEVSASDPDGHDITLSVESSNPNVAVAELVESDDPLGGGEGIFLSVVSYRVGTTQVTVTAADEFGGVGSATLEVMVTNTRPEINLAVEEITITGVGELGTVGYRATDRDGDDLTVTAITADGTIATPSVSMADDEVRVTSTGVGETMITVTVDDGQPIDNTASAEFSVTVLNRDPEVTLAEAAITITGVGVNASVDGAATDPDGHEITLSATSTAPDVASASVAGSASGGPISVTVTSNSVGTAEITVTAIDPYDASGSATVAVVVENRPPTIAVAPESVSINGVGETGSATVTSGDPDGHDVTVSVASANEDVATASLSGTGLTVTSTGVGSTTITLTATDGQASNNSATAELSVDVLNRPPTVSVSPTSLSVIAGGNTGTATVTMDDPDGHALAVTVSSSDAAIAVATMSGSSMSVTSGNPGSATITVSVDDGNGGTASADLSVTVTNAAPTVAALSDMTMQLGGDAATVTITAADSDGHTVTLSITNGTPAVASTTLLTSTISANALSVGTTLVTVTATDPYGATGTASFTITVSDSELKAVASRSIAAMGRAHIASVSSAIEGRMAGASSAAGGSSLTSLFELDAFTRYLPTDTASGSSRQPSGGFQDVRSLNDSARSSSVGLPQHGSRDVRLDVDQILGLNRLKKGFNFNLGQAMGGNLGLWGAVDNQSYDGGEAYDGSMTNFWVGADITMESDMLIGLAVGRSSGESDYTFGSVTRTMELNFTSFMPYAGMTPDDETAIWGAFAFGSGDLETAGATSDLSVSTGVIGGRRSLNMMEGIDVAVKGDYGFSTMETDDGNTASDGISASVSRIRIGLEGSWVSEVSDGQSFEPFVDVGFRSDGGDGDTGSGIEIGGGIRLCADNFKLEARGRVTASHDALDGDYSETGFGVVASVNPSGDGSGLSLALSPSWGGNANFSGEMFKDQASLTRELDRDAFRTNGNAIDASVGYGFKISNDRMLITPHVALNSSSDALSTIVLGVRLVNLIHTDHEFDLEFLASQSEGYETVKNRVGIKGTIRF